MTTQLKRWNGTQWVPLFNMIEANDGSVTFGGPVTVPSLTVTSGVTLTSLNVGATTITGAITATGQTMTAARYLARGATGAVSLGDRDGSTNESWEIYNTGNSFRVWSESQGADRLQMSGGEAYWPGSGNFVLGNNVGANPSWRFHWSGSAHYMDFIGGSDNPLYFRSGAANNNLVMTSRNIFRDSETWGTSGLRVGGAYGMCGIWAESGAAFVGGVGGLYLQHQSNTYVQGDGSIIFQNAQWNLWARDTGGTPRGVLIGRHNNNTTYLDGGAELYIRTQNGGSHVATFGNGFLRLDCGLLRFNYPDEDTYIAWNGDGRLDFVSNGVLAAYTTGGVWGLNEGHQTVDVGPNAAYTGFGLMRKYVSKRALKDNIEDLTGAEALDVLDRMRPRTFTAKPQPYDSETTAALRPLVKLAGFIVEEMDEVGAPFKLVSYAPNAPQDATPEEKEAIATDLDRYVPETWESNAVIAVLVSAVKELASKVRELEGAGA